MQFTSALRERADLCPGALSVHEAADGRLARIRLPGGALSAAQLDALATATAELGDGRLELTSRGNVQIRALPAGAEVQLGERLALVGLLPSATHERVRNIVASPLAGVDGRGAELSGLVTDLDRELCARAGLAALPGRFLFALDDGRGDVARLGADVTLVTRTAGRVWVGTLEVTIDAAVPVMLALAEAFLAERAAQGSQAWRITELGGGLAAVAARAMAGFGAAEIQPAADLTLPEPPGEPVGVLAQPGGLFALTVLAPLGRLSAAQAHLLAAHAGARGLRITPWRSVVLLDLADAGAAAAAAAAVGLGIDASSRWYRVSACTGRPGCAQALADVQADAAEATGRWAGRQVHWSGCAHRCGRPHDTEVDIIATDEGYAISE